jgi:hypothetical protein
MISELPFDFDNQTNISQALRKNYQRFQYKSKTPDSPVLKGAREK